MTDLAAALRAPLPSEVTIAGTVLGEPTSFVGTRTHAHHEEFPLRSDDGVRVDVVDNVDLAPWAPVHRGDRVEVRGELVGTPQQPVVHYTHRDPHGRHADGYIRFDGRVYA